MADPEQANRMKPVVILPPDHMTPEDIQELRENGICVVTAKKPDAVRFMEPPAGDYAAAEQAAIELFRRVVRSESSYIEPRDVARQFAVMLTEGRRLQPPARVEPVEQTRRRGRPKKT